MQVRRRAAYKLKLPPYLCERGIENDYTAGFSAYLGVGFDAYGEGVLGFGHGWGCYPAGAQGNAP